MGILRLAPLLALALGGCVTIEVGDQDRGQRTTRTHIGITRIVTPATQGNIAAVDVSTLGLGWDQGPFLGWHEGELVYADPGDCQLIVIIKKPVQAENAAQVLAALGGQNPCIADFTGRLGAASR